MPDPDRRAPRVFIACHGETRWSLRGRYESTSEHRLTAAGNVQVSATASVLVGADKLIDPAKLTRVYCSPRRRARQTLGLLLGMKRLWGTMEEDDGEYVLWKGDMKITVTEAVAEWDYGDYEGMWSDVIRVVRREDGLRIPWDIWEDGCEEGESPEQVAKRLDGVIEQIREFQDPLKFSGGGDVLIVAHSHILCAFAKRWLELPINSPLSIIMRPGAVGVLSYAGEYMDQPTLPVGMGFSPQASRSLDERRV